MKTTSWLSFWQLGLIGLLTSAGINAFTCKTLAQTTPSNIQPDATLGAESSRIVPNFQGLRVEVIQGGATRGINLFHSLREFNVSEGRGAYFFSPGADIQNILARVTGANRSEILGTLGTFGNSQPNLFLINPNGIIFGKNASLDVQGSFVGTTANGVKFGNQGEFSATNPEPVPLLTINPSALFVNQINKSAAIQNNSVAPAGIDSSGFNRFGLRVPDGKSLLLVGGNVSMDGGWLNALGGRVELGGLAAPGNVNLFFNGDNLSLKFPDNVTRADVSLTNQARVYVEAAGGGDIAINARNIDILRGSQLSAGIGRGLGTPETVAGNITLNATGEINFAGSGSVIFNNVRQGAKGNGGNVFIDSGSFSLQDGAVLAASTLGQGNAGNVTVSAKNAVSLAGNAYIFSTVEAGGVGKGGNIDINAATLSLTNGAQLLTITRGASDTQPAGRGDAGDVNVKVSGAVDIAGVKNGFASGIRSLVDTGTFANGGNITIDSGSFSLRDGALLNASTYGQGNAGSVTVSAKNAVSLADDAAILSTVEAGGVGKGGNIDINAATLSLTNGAQLLTITRGASSTQPAGRGDAGNVNVKVSGAVDIAGVKNGFVSGILSNVETGTVGNGGNIIIDSGSFSLRDGAELTAATSGQGNAGNVTVSAKNAVSVADNAYILSTVEAGGVGKGGNIDINAATLSLTDGAQLLTITRGASDTQPAGRGDAGDVNVKVSGAVDIAGVKNGFRSGFRSLVRTGTVGNGGNITIDADSFSLRNGAVLNAATFGQGNAGNVTVSAKNTVSLAGNAGVFSTVEAGGVGKGGNIDINAATLSLTDGAQLLTITRGASSTQPAGRGDAGNVNVKVSGTVDIAGVKNGFVSGILSNVDTGTVGNGGNITIDADSLSLRDGARLDAATLGPGNAGNVTVNAADFFTISGNSSRFNSGLYVDSASATGTAGDIIVNSPKVTLDNQGTLNAQSASGNGGNIILNVSDLLLMRRNSQISTTAGTAQAGGDGGNININSKFIIAPPDENSDITANAFTGTGGNINIVSQGIFGIEPRRQLTDKSDITASSNFGISGNIQILSPDVSGLQNALIQISPNAIDTNALIAGSCIASGDKKQQNSFYITGSGALRYSPGGISPSNYTTGEVRNVSGENRRGWKKGDPIIEPTGVYYLPTGQILLSRECQ